MDFDKNIKCQLNDYLFKQKIISPQTLWYPQTGGRTNKVWLINGEKNLICKLYLETKSNPLFSNTPEAEYNCLVGL